MGSPVPLLADLRVLSPIRSKSVNSKQLKTRYTWSSQKSFKIIDRDYKFYQCYQSNFTFRPDSQGKYFGDEDEDGESQAW